MPFKNSEDINWKGLKDAGIEWEWQGEFTDFIKGNDILANKVFIQFWIYVWMQSVYIKWIRPTNFLKNIYF